MGERDTGMDEHHTEKVRGERMRNRMEKTNKCAQQGRNNVKCISSQTESEPEFLPSFLPPSLSRVPHNTFTFWSH